MAKKIAELTTQEFEHLLEEFYAEPKKRSKMTPEEMKDLAQRLNRKINIPILDETGEEKILIKVILKIDNFLYDNLPNEFYDLVRSADKGIDKKEAKRLIRRLTKCANQKIDIPYLPEPVEHFALRFVIGMIVKASQKTLDFERIRADSDNIKVPDTDEEIESMLDD
ncbi:MAG: hypothetical protein ACOC1D_04765 [Prolixibacteraceae bacterium]